MTPEEAWVLKEKFTITPASCEGLGKGGVCSDSLGTLAIHANLFCPGQENSYSSLKALR